MKTNFEEGISFEKGFEIEIKFYPQLCLLGSYMSSEIYTYLQECVCMSGGVFETSSMQTHMASYGGIYSVWLLTAESLKYLSCQTAQNEGEGNRSSAATTTVQSKYPVENTSAGLGTDSSLGVNRASTRPVVRTGRE